MPDEIIKELWQIKDSIAREHGYNIDALIAHFRSKEKPAGQRVVDLRTMRENAEQGAPADAYSTQLI